MRHGGFRPSNVDADLRVRNTWVTSVDVTMKTRARKAVLLHLGEGFKIRIRGGGGLDQGVLLSGGEQFVSVHSTRIEQTQTSCMNSES